MWTGCSRGDRSLGHADPETLAAVHEAADRGTTFGAPTEAEVELAAEIVDAVPSIEMVRLVGSGTEASMSTLRLARGDAARPRDHVRGLLPRPRRRPPRERRVGVMTLGIPSSPGVPTGVTADTIVCSFNDVDGVAAACERHGEGLAAILVEPVAGNMGCIPPAPGFLEALRALADATGALLVFDEVITGFRVARGGAQERFGVTPDLTVLGKIVGGGSRRGVRRSRRPDGEPRPGRHRVPGGDAPVTRSRPPPACPSSVGCVRTRCTTSSSASLRGSRRASPRTVSCSASARC